MSRNKKASIIVKAEPRQGLSIRWLMQFVEPEEWKSDHIQNICFRDVDFLLFYFSQINVDKVQ